MKWHSSCIGFNDHAILLVAIELPENINCLLSHFYLKLSTRKLGKTIKLCVLALGAQ